MPLNSLDTSRYSLSFLAISAGLCAALWDSKAQAADIKRSALTILSVIALGFLLARIPAWPRNRKKQLLPLKIPIFHPILWWCIFIGWMSISRLWGSPGGDLWLGTLFSGLCIALCVRFYQPKEAPPDNLPALCAIPIACISSLFVLIQALRGARGIELHGGQGNPNWLGLVLALTLPLCLEFAFYLRKSGRLRLFALMLTVCALQLPALWLSHSRVAWIALSIAFFSAFVLWLFRPGFLKKRLPAALAISIASICIFTLLYFNFKQPPAPAEPPAPREDTEAQVASDVPIQQAWQGRLWIWRISLLAAKDAFPFGHGLGDFSHAYLGAQGPELKLLPLRTASRRFENAQTAHSDWIESLASGGLPALMCLGASAALLFLAYARAQRPLAAAAVLCAALCAAGDSPLHQPAFSVLFGVLLGCAPSLEPARSTHIRFPKLFFGIAFLLSVYLSARAFRHYIATRLCTKAEQLALPALSQPLIGKAASLDTQHGQAALLLGLWELDHGDPARAVSELQRSASLLANPGTPIALGNAFMALHQPERAITAYSQSLAWNPASFRAHLNLALALMDTRNYSEAEHHLSAARALFPGHPKLAQAAEYLRKARIDDRTQSPDSPLESETQSP